MLFSQLWAFSSCCSWVPVTVTWSLLFVFSFLSIPSFLQFFPVSLSWLSTPVFSLPQLSPLPWLPLRVNRPAFPEALSQYLLLFLCATWGVYIKDDFILLAALRKPKIPVRDNGYNNSGYQLSHLNCVFCFRPWACSHRIGGFPHYYMTLTLYDSGFYECHLLQSEILSHDDKMVIKFFRGHIKNNSKMQKCWQEINAGGSL